MEETYKVKIGINSRFAILLILFISFFLFYTGMCLFFNMMGYLFIGLIVFIFVMVMLFLVFMEKINQKIIIKDDLLLINSSKNDIEEFYYNKISLYGLYKEKNDKIIGIYIYSEDIDRYIVIGRDIENLDKLQDFLFEKLSNFSAKKIDIIKEKKKSISEQILELIENRN